MGEGGGGTGKGREGEKEGAEKMEDGRGKGGRG